MKNLTWSNWNLVTYAALNSGRVRQASPLNEILLGNIHVASVPGSDLSSRGAERTCAKAQETGATAMHCRRREHRKVRIRDCFLSCSFTIDAFRYIRTPLEAISRIHATSGTVLEIKNTKPCAALRVLAEKIGGSQENRNKWRDEARVAAVMGSCPRSKASHDSGTDFV
jgi:hypothetical protein